MRPQIQTFHQRTQEITSADTSQQVAASAPQQQECTALANRPRRASEPLQGLTNVQASPGIGSVSSGPLAPQTGAGPRGRRTLAKWLAMDTDVRPKKPGEFRLEKLAGKIGQLASKAKTTADNTFVSGQISIFGIHTETTVGKPVTMATTGPERAKARPSYPIPARADMPPAPPTGPAHTPARQRKIDAAVRATFNPGPSIAELLRHPLGRKPAAAPVPITEAMGTAEGMQARLGQLFGSRAGAPGMQALHTALLGTFAARLVSASARPFARHVLLAEALANASEGDAVRAMAALRVLQSGRFLPMSFPENQPASPLGAPRFSDTGAGALHPARSSFPDDGMGLSPAQTARAKLDALHVGQALASIGDVGIQTLAASIPGLEPARHEPLEFVLQSAERITQETRGRKVHLGEILAHADAVRGTSADTLACKVLRAEVRGLGAEHPVSGLDRADKAAVFAWRQGFRSDEKRSPLRRTQERFAKFRKYVARAEKRDALNKMHFDPRNPIRSAGKLATKTAGLVTNNVQRVFSHQKSPLLGLGKYGALAAGAQLAPTDQVRLDEHLITAMGELNAYLKSSDAPARAVQRGAIPLPVLRAAVLAHWADASETRRPQGHVLDAAAVADIAGRLQLYPAATATQSADVAKRLPAQLTSLIGTRLTHATLEHWGHDAATPQRSVDGKETVFAGAMRRARNILDPGKDVPADMTADSMRAFLKNFVIEHNGGNSMTFTDGGALGINTGALSVNVAMAAAAATQVLVQPIVDVQASVARSAVFTIGTSSHGGEIFIGRQRQLAGQVGGGVMIGYVPSTEPGETAFAARLGVAVNTTLFGLEHNHPVGVRLRFARQRNASGNDMVDKGVMRRQMETMVDYLFDACGPAKRHLSPAALWEDFANHHFDQENLSVAWQDYSALSSRMGVSVTGSARLGVKTDGGETVRTGGLFGYAFNWSPFTRGKRQEASGRFPVMRNERGVMYSHTVTVATGTQLPSVPLPDSHEGGADSLGLPNVPIHSATYMLGEGGFNAIVRTLMEHGRHSETFTYRDLSERSIHDFLKIANEPGRRKAWEALCAAEQGGDAARGKARLDDFLDKVREMARPNQAYYMRWRLGTEERLAMDDYLGVAKIAERGGRAAHARDSRQAMEAIAGTEASWRPSGLFTMHNQSRQTDTGLNFGLQATARTTASSDRQLMFLGLPLPISDAWTSVARGVAAAGGAVT
ncbi:hypothetical protein GRB31_06135 [Ralstonia solanacearum]|nr:hypothetical protein GRB31_06135 [Ralstonia solanacearum]